MANSLTAVIGADTTQFTQAINQAKNVLAKYTNEAKKASKEIKDNASVNDSQVASYTRVIRQLEKVNSGTMSTTKQTKALKTQIQELKIQWNGLSDDAKKGEFGQAMSNTIKSAQNQLSNLNKQIEQTKTTTNSATKSSDGFNLSIGNMSALIGKLSPYIAAATTAFKVYKDSIQQCESSIDGWGIVTKQAESAYNTFLTSLNTGNWNAFFNNLNDAINGAAELYNKLDKLGSVKANNAAPIAIAEQAINSIRNKLKNATGDEKTQLEAELQGWITRLSRLKNEGIKAGKEAGKEMMRQVLREAGVSDGALMESVITNYLTKGDSFVEGAKRQLDELQKKVGTKYVRTQSSSSSAGWTSQDILMTVDDYSKMTRAEKARYDILKAFVDKETLLQQGAKQYAESVSESSTSLKETYKYTNYIKNNQKVIKEDSKKIADNYQDQYQELLKMQSEKNVKEFNSIIKKYSNYKLDFNDPFEKLVEDINKPKELYKELEKLAVFAKLGNGTAKEEAEKMVIQISDAIDYAIKQSERLQDGLDRFNTQAFYTATTNRFVTQYEQLKDVLRKYELLSKTKNESTGEMFINEDDYSKFQKRMKSEFLGIKADAIADTAKQAYGAADAIDSIGRAFSKSSWEGKDFGEQMLTVASSFLTLYDAIREIIDVVYTVSQGLKMFSNASKVSSVATVEETAAIDAKAASETAEASIFVASTQAKAATIPELIAISTANQVQTATENTAAYAAIPFVGAELAAACMAQYKAMWAAAAIPMFADGGIISGNRTIGDMNLARVNSGEMILNGSQQKHLFNLINDGISTQSSTGGNVHFRIEGKDLVGVLNNYDSRQRRVR